MFRSSSGPSLSINTASANALGTSASAPPPAGGPQAKSLFGNPPSAPPQQSSSVFNAPQPATTKSQNMGSLFGASTTTSQPNGGLFGAPANKQPSGTLLGSLNTQQAPTQSTGSLFNSTSLQNQSQSQPQQPSGLFGNSIASQAQPSVFNNTQGISQSQPSTLQQSAPVSIFSSVIGQQSQQQNTVPGVRISVNELRPSTRFNDLHEELQKAIEYVDAFVMNKIQWQEQCEAATDTMQDLSQQLPPDVEHCSKRLKVVQQCLESDAVEIASAKNTVKSDAADAKLSFKVINNLKLPQQFHQSSLWGAASAPQSSGPDLSADNLDQHGSQNMVEYFSKQAENLSKSLETYKRNVAEIEMHLKDVESSTLHRLQQSSLSDTANGSSSTAQDQIRELSAVLREFEVGILGVAAQVGSVREAAQESMLGSSIDRNLQYGSQSPSHGIRGHG